MEPPLLMWVDTFIPGTQMSQYKICLSPWLKGIQWLSKAYGWCTDAEDQGAPRA